MEKGRTRYKWLPLAVAAAFALSNPFMLVAVGTCLGLIFLCCDKRAAYRKVAGIALLPLVALGLWLAPILTFFALGASFFGVWTLRENFFSTVTSSALVGSLAAAALTVILIWATGGEGWQKIEENAAAVQERWQQMATSEETADLDRLEAWERWNRMAVRLLPGQFMMMMIISFFLTVIIYRRYGETDHPLSLGCSHFYQYRFEDNWIWMVILGLVLVLLFTSNEVLVRLALNILFVMGILYVIRGLAVMFYFIAMRNGGIILRVLLVALCLTPMILFHLLFGLLDTWLDFRKTVPAAK